MPKLVRVTQAGHALTLEVDGHQVKVDDGPGVLLDNAKAAALSVRAAQLGIPLSVVEASAMPAGPAPTDDLAVLRLELQSLRQHTDGRFGVLGALADLPPELKGTGSTLVEVLESLVDVLKTNGVDFPPPGS